VVVYVASAIVGMIKVKQKALVIIEDSLNSLHPEFQLLPLRIWKRLGSIHFECNMQNGNAIWKIAMHTIM